MALDTVRPDLTTEARRTRRPPEGGTPNAILRQKFFSAQVGASRASRCRLVRVVAIRCGAVAVLLAQPREPDGFTEEHEGNEGEVGGSGSGARS